MTQPDPHPENLLALFWKLLQLWTKSPQNWKRNLFLSIVTVLSALYGIGSIPSPQSSVESAKPEPQPAPSVQQGGQCNHNTNGSNNTFSNSPTCPTSTQVSPGGLSVNSLHTGGVTLMGVYNSGLSASGRASLSAAISLPAPANGGTTLKVNPISSQHAGNVFLPIAIGFYRTEKIAGQIGGSFYTGAAAVGGTIVEGAKRVKRWVAQTGEPGRPEPSNAAPRSCSFGSQ